MYELVTLKSGLKSLRALDNLETYHPGVGPSAEAQILHVDQQKLVERAQTVSKFVIWDVGLGAAANAITAIQTLLASNLQETEIELHSFDRTTSALEFAIENSAELQYLHAHTALLKSLLAERSVQVSPRIRWHFHLADFRESLLKGPNLPAPHAVLYDPYSPTKNPDMWTLDHFQRLRLQLMDSSPCLLTNYTRSTAVRVTWLLAGFYVGHGVFIGEKAETTVASNQLGLLDRPLEKNWLERVVLSRNSAPIQMPYTQATISEAQLAELRNHPQFA